MRLAAMRDYIAKRGWTIALEIQDVGSGASLRPKREELLRAARRRELDRIVVWRLDRRRRSLLDLVVALQELASLNVGFVSLSEALDITAPSDHALAWHVGGLCGLCGARSYAMPQRQSSTVARVLAMRDFA
jgi:putative DNA-invertase from lambdoid prophage Rac